jgi:CheY-like chemotaxis protein
MDRKNILLIGNIQESLLLSRKLHLLGHEIIATAENFEETQKIVSEKNPDVVIMDLHGQNPEIQERIEDYLELFLKDSLPLIFLTNKVSRKFKMQTGKLSCFTFLLKPTEAIEIDAIIRKLVPSETEKDLGSENLRLKALERYDILNTVEDWGLDRITFIAAAFFNVPVAAISFSDEQNIIFKSVYNQSFDVLKKDVIPAEAFLPSTFFALTGKEAAEIGNLLSPDSGFVFYASAPLTTPDGYTIGALSIFDKTSRSISDSAEKILLNFAAIVMDELELKLSSKKAAVIQHSLIDLATAPGKAETPSEENLSQAILTVPSSIKEEQKGTGKLSSFIKDKTKEPEQVKDEFFEKSFLFSADTDSLVHQIINLSELADEVVKKLGSTALDKNQNLKLFIESIPQIIGDKEKLKLVLENLIDNAIKYSPFNSTIEVNVISAEEKAYIEVRDQGQGLSEEEKALVFNIPQISTEETPKESITVNGLPIVKKIIELHGGKIWVESEGKNLGSRFIIEFPKQ